MLKDRQLHLYVSSILAPYDHEGGHAAMYDSVYTYHEGNDGVSLLNSGTKLR